MRDGEAPAESSRSNLGPGGTPARFFYDHGWSVCRKCRSIFWHWMVSMAGRKMNRFAAFLLILSLTACSTWHVHGNDVPLSLIPMPAVVERSPGYFALRRG